MKNSHFSDLSLSDVHGSVEVNSTGPRWKQIFSFFGPAYLVSVGYMDPGNWATDIEAGSNFEYRLLWVLLLSYTRGHTPSQLAKCFSVGKRLTSTPISARITNAVPTSIPSIV